MKRHSAKLALFLLLGAIINIAVAWGFAICFDTWPARYQWIERLGFTYIGEPPDLVTWRVGFPMRSLTCKWNRGGVVAGDFLTMPTPLPDRYAIKGDEAWLPVGPIWPGFAINTIFYAAIAWLPFASLRRIPRQRRIKRGLCPSCAYPIGASDVCTECGETIKGKSQVDVRADL